MNGEPTCPLASLAVLAQHFLCASPSFQVGLLTTPNGPAHNPSGAGSQPLVGKLPRGCEQAGLEGHA